METRIATIRRFNRFYTGRIGVLHEGLLDSSFTLTESRLLWELAHRERLTASELARTLDLDPGYLSRLLSGFKARGLIKRTRSKNDARHQHLSLTAAGKRAFAPLDARSQAEVSTLLAPLQEVQQQQLLASMTSIERLLGAPVPRAAPFELRAHRAGDIGWVIARHGALYAEEYGWDMGFEALVARIAADFIERFDPAREACWIAERDAAPIGSVFLVQARDEITHAAIDGSAQLRLLLVEQSARGLGLGVRLVDECTRFARRVGYRKIVLWTNASLLAARGIYRKAGYVLTHSEPHRSFGHDLIGETWELRL
ncbi:MAG TPA: helix-turn-helix domain-containing GNAT family N-acetyltransferase [Burkholderiaceae bacterium]|nr:helix-turn-helix domain-containing GNAT family N-acetyltransferase [Burkholderiaceae bacterium]